MLQIKFVSITYEIALGLISQKAFNDKSAWVQAILHKGPLWGIGSGNGFRQQAIT